HRRFSTLVRMESVLRRRSDDGGGESRRTALAVRAGAEDRVRETDGTRFRPGDVFTEGRSDADQVRSARERATDSHRLVGARDASLLLRERGRHAERLPLTEIRPER